VRERWTSGNTYYARAFTAMTPPVPEERLTVVDRCYAFPVTGEVRTRLRGTVYLARFCYSGELPAPGPISAEVRPVPS
jgi:hypothetical protein